jgi:hypothetical protein
MTVMISSVFSFFPLFFFLRHQPTLAYQGFRGTCCFVLTADTSETSMTLFCHHPVSLHIHATYEIPVYSCPDEVTAVYGPITTTVLYIFTFYYNQQTHNHIITVYIIAVSLYNLYSYTFRRFHIFIRHSSILVSL